MQTGDWNERQFQIKTDAAKMKYRVQISVFGKEMKADVEAPNEAEAMDIILREVKRQVKLVSILPIESDRATKKVEDLFKAMGIWQ